MPQKEIIHFTLRSKDKIVNFSENVNIIVIKFTSFICDVYIRNCPWIV